MSESPCLEIGGGQIVRWGWWWCSSHCEASKPAHLTPKATCGHLPSTWMSKRDVKEAYERRAVEETWQNYSRWKEIMKCALALRLRWDDVKARFGIFSCGQSTTQLFRLRYIPFFAENKRYIPETLSSSHDRQPLQQGRHLLLNLLFIRSSSVVDMWLKTSF